MRELINYFIMQKYKISIYYSLIMLSDKTIENRNGGNISYTWFGKEKIATTKQEKQYEAAFID